MPPERSEAASRVLRPLEAAGTAIRDGLKTRLRGYRSDLNGYWGTLLALVTASDQTMRAAMFLVGDERVLEQQKGDGPGPFPAQTVILQRSILEVLGNVLVVAEDRRYRDDLFRRDGYREDARRHRVLSERFAAGTLMQRKKSDWETALKRMGEGLRQEAGFLRLTRDEVADPVRKLQSWPSPSDMLTKVDRQGRRWLTDSRLLVFQHLYDDSYGSDSRVCHQKDLALHLNMEQASRLSVERLALVRNIPVLRAATHHACVLTEVGHEFDWPKNSKSELRRAWSRLVQILDPALEVYRLRYRALLRRSACP